MMSGLPLDEPVIAYYQWIINYPFVFLSEVQAIQEFLVGGEDIQEMEFVMSDHLNL